MQLLPPELSERVWPVRAGVALTAAGLDPRRLPSLFAEADRELVPVLRDVNARIEAEATVAAGQMPVDIGAKSLYVLTRAVRPAKVVETGVASGMSSTAWLAALHRSRHGHLYSVDLPKPAGDVEVEANSPLPPGRGSGWAIPDDLRDRFDLRLGPSQQLLPGLLAELDNDIDIFFHDSDHSAENMRWEFEQAWQALRPGGWLVSHDVHKHGAFQTFCKAHGARPVRILITGFARKPGD